MTPNPAVEPTNAIACAAAELRSARSGGDGLKLADDESPDLVLLDVQMPGMDGYEICRLLGQGPRTRKVPVVMLTASDDPALNQRAYAVGALDCVLKPFRGEGLVTTIQTVLVGKPHGVRLPLGSQVSQKDSVVAEACPPSRHTLGRLSRFPPLSPSALAPIHMPGT